MTAEQHSTARQALEDYILSYVPDATPAVADGVARYVESIMNGVDAFTLELQPSPLPTTAEVLGEIDGLLAGRPGERS